MIEASEVKTLINEYAKKGESFLFCIDFELNEGLFIQDPLSQSEVLFRTKKHTNFKPQTSQTKVFVTNTSDLDSYAQKFDIVQKGLLNGDSFLTNLTVKTPLNTDYTLREIALASKSEYLLYVPEKFVSFSPETFVTIDKEGVISTNPMKGTISCNVDSAEQVILNDYKERSEHFTIVDLLRSDISRIATNVKVSRLRYVDRLSTSKGDILQVSSQIDGELLSEYKSAIGDTLFELLPAGSVSGAPKKSTLQIIANAEGEPRGFYCGVFGYFDGKELDSAVLIRYIEKCDDKLYFRSGAGITINSDCKSEYKENIQKIYLPFTNKYIESVKIIDGVIQNFEYHRQRALQTTGIVLSEPSVPLDMQSGIVKCRLVYDQHLISTEFVPYQKAAIRTLKIVNVEENLYNKKFEDRSWMKSLYDLRGDYDDVLIAVNGMVTDTSFCNVVFEDDNGLYTPTTTLLCGTKRQVLLDCGIIQTKEITLADICKFNKIHLINAMLDIGDITINITDIYQ